MGLSHHFGTPIFSMIAEGEKFNQIQDELWGVYNKINMKHLPFCPDAHDVSTDKDDKFFRGDLLKAYNCKYFLSYLDHAVRQYIKSVENAQSGVKDGKPLQVEFHRTSKYYISEAWFTKTTHLRYAPHHNHGDSDVSGVYYLDTNGKDGMIKIKSPNRYFVGNYVYSIMTASDCSIPLKNGILGLWPAILDHSTEANETDHERISLSFNIVFKDKALTGLDTSDHNYF